MPRRHGATSWPTKPKSGPKWSSSPAPRRSNVDKIFHIVSFREIAGASQLPPSCPVMGWPGRAPALQDVESCGGLRSTRSTSHVTQIRTIHRRRHDRHRLGKNSFHLVGLDQRGAIVLQLKCSRAQLERRLANIPSCLIGMEACSGAHYIGRQLAALGHDVRLIPAQYVKPFLKGHKNDYITVRQGVVQLRKTLPDILGSNTHADAQRDKESPGLGAGAFKESFLMRTSRDQGALDAPRYYPKAQIRQGTDRPGADRRGLETGGRDLPRRARDSGGASCPTDPCQRGVALLKLKVTRLAYRKCPDPPRGSRRAGTSRAPEAGPLPTPPAIALSHGRSTSG
jgi:hypothetical protein